MLLHTTLPNGHEVALGADCKKTRNGFKHEVWVLDGTTRLEAKVCYLNWTWEAYRYQTALHRLMEKYVAEVLNYSQRRKGFYEVVKPYNEAIDELLASMGWQW